MQYPVDQRCQSAELCEALAHVGGQSERNGTAITLINNSARYWEPRLDIDEGIPIARPIKSAAGENQLSAQQSSALVVRARKLFGTPGQVPSESQGQICISKGLG